MTLFVAFTWATVGCRNSQSPATSGAENAAGDPALKARIQAGKAAYQSMCIQCHGTHPSVSGTIGPALAQIELETLRAKVLEGKYPPGVKPRGKTNAAMPAFPQFKDQIEAIHAYLQTFPYTP